MFSSHLHFLCVPDRLPTIYNYTPRKVNKVTYASLMAAPSQKKQLIDDYLVKEVIMSELEL
jgi:hypothetical protein